MNTTECINKIRLMKNPTLNIELSDDKKDVVISSPIFYKSEIIALIEIGESYGAYFKITLNSKSINFHIIG